MNSFVFIYITTSTMEEAKNLASLLLEKKLIACANMFPIVSMYHWDGKIVEDGEVVLLVKTLSDVVSVIRREVAEFHSYTVPCIAVLYADANQLYYTWLCEQVEKP